MGNPVEISLCIVALQSRLFLWVMQFIFNLLPDHNADAFKPRLGEDNEGLFDQGIRFLFDGYHKWDAQYVLHIAENGYTEEKNFAFFPAFPFLLRSLANLLNVLPLSYLSCLLVSGAILNTIFFVGAAISLFRLTNCLSKSKQFSTLSSLCFIFNPASIFFSSNYTESLFAFCVFSGLYHLEKKSCLVSSLYFAVAASTRSNGIVNVGFLGYHALREIRRAKETAEKLRITDVVRSLTKCFILCFVTFVPFLAFNYLGYVKFCSDNPAAIPEWCSRSVPLVYSHVQNHHWDIGFLNYFKWRKLPNFLLATPCAVLMSRGIFIYLDANRHEIAALGLSQNNADQKRANAHELQKLEAFQYVVHALFLLVFGMFFMHVEVITRFIASSSPLPYWIAASIFYRDFKSPSKTYIVSSIFHIPLTNIYARSSTNSKMLILYASSYIFLGTLLHVNFLPWT